MGLKTYSPDLVGVLESLCLMCCEYDVSLSMEWIPSGSGTADAPSRELESDAALLTGLRLKVWGEFGPFSIDLMALPSNVLKKPSGRPLPFFLEFAVPGSSGVDVFAQRRPHGVVYAFSPFIVIPALINLMLDWGSVVALLVLPLHSSSRPAWRNLLCSLTASPFFSRIFRRRFSAIDLGFFSEPAPSQLRTTGSRAHNGFRRFSGDLFILFVIFDVFLFVLLLMQARRVFSRDIRGKTCSVAPSSGCMVVILVLCLAAGTVDSYIGQLRTFLN